MKDENKYTRRNFVGTIGLATGGLCLLPLAVSCKSDASQKSISAGKNISKDFNADVDIQLKAEKSNTKIVSSGTADTYSYRASLYKGAKSTLQELEGSSLGPIIRVKKGNKVRIRFENEIPEKSIIHWHGLHVSHENDGHPEYVIGNGETYFYEFEVMNSAGMYWFHPHPHRTTGEQVYKGLAGLFIVEDDEEKALNLPTGDYDIPVVIQDRTFDESGQLVYLPNGKMDRMRGFLGNQILINGKIDNTLSLNKDGKYRLRLLNGSNSRAYKLAWDTGEPLTVFGVDGGLLQKHKTLPYLLLGPAQRVDVWLDLTNKNENEEIKLIHLPIPLDAMMGDGMMDDGMMGNASDNALPYNSQFDILSIKVGVSKKNEASLPETLSRISPLKLTDAINRNTPRTFNFGMENMMEWTINGRTYEGMQVADDEIVKLNTTEIWRINNGGNTTSAAGNDGGGMMGMHGNGGMMGNGGGMGNMMQMPHPVHIHQLQFNIVNRNIDNIDQNLWNAVKDGFINEGWQDSVYLLPGMYMDLVMRFEDFKGLFLYHCHNLEHEDMGMMRNFKIE
ncbi:multicopper oxidase family protein [Leeuwenhoekiella nanhaiensis]|uniref:Multicopper oxidase CueO n=1 Tax=Leeuwenhoekiella nanhaiensis TaxID=1655491 RepID=A0A2G1VMI3_9FLAO|nr:multicopper oxidase family protein [Leeuwenhoekiella nanhaiensis]PHQ27944.1 bilirubin oxidase [Leeuwenhoekiella nanhaiensis]